MDKQIQESKTLNKGDSLFEYNSKSGHLAIIEIGHVTKTTAISTCMRYHFAREHDGQKARLLKKARVMQGYYSFLQYMLDTPNVRAEHERQEKVNELQRTIQALTLDALDIEQLEQVQHLLNQIKAVAK